MSSTTLMTFLLCTAPTVRSVELLGSWDNFNRSYPMDQDKRIGAGHWRGCHTFTDIICDGAPYSRPPGRSGGLKMGGTYWYYYRLDGDIEYYNETEPVTTLCPFLPGQPINILHVPIVLPDTSKHRREGSASSLNLDRRTMDPRDKYMNPRTPPRPKLPRLNTSPPLLQHVNSSWSSLLNLPLNFRNRSVSQPASTTASPKFRVAPKSKGLRAAFLHLASNQSVGGKVEDCHYDRIVMRKDGTNSSTPQTSTYRDDDSNCARLVLPFESESNRQGMEGLPFRRQALEKEDCPPPAIWNRRASRPGRSDHSPFLNPPTLVNPARDIYSGGRPRFSNTKSLETLHEALSQLNTPSLVPGEPGLSVHDYSSSIPIDRREKRLPTLPNSPSSVMNEALRAMDTQNGALDMEVFRSHFSDYTSTNGSVTFDNSPHEKSHFSEWGSDTELVSPSSMTSFSTTIVDDTVAEPSISSLFLRTSSGGPATPTLSPTPKSFPTAVARQSLTLLPETSISSVGVSSDDLGISGLCIEGSDEVDGNPKRYATIFPGLGSINSYSLPTKGTPTNPAMIHGNTNILEKSSAMAKISESDRFGTSLAFQSSIMKELMDELSYLGDAIQAST